MGNKLSRKPPHHHLISFQTQKISSIAAPHALPSRISSILPHARPPSGRGSTKLINESRTIVRSSSCSTSTMLFFRLMRRRLWLLLREREDMLLKLKVEKREVAVAAERGEVEDVLGGAVRGLRGDVGDCGDEEEEKAVRSLRRELRGCRSWNLEEGIVVGCGFVVEVMSVETNVVIASFCLSTREYRLLIGRRSSICLSTVYTQRILVFARP